jgi:hypothetical protein
MHIHAISLQAIARDFDALDQAVTLSKWLCAYLSTPLSIATTYPFIVYLHTLISRDIISLSISFAGLLTPGPWDMAAIVQLLLLAHACSNRQQESPNRHIQWN